jgi:hypothetical protein
MTTASTSEALFVPNAKEADPRQPAGDYRDLVARLNRASVHKYYLPFTDIPWDEHTLDPGDPRWILHKQDLAQTAWFQHQPVAVQARLSLHMSATFMKYGAQFENVLSRGLLEFAATLPNHAPDFRYAYHELIEESNHSLMFQEFVNRSGLDVPGLSPWLRRRFRGIAALGARFPELFFVFVLGGEDQIDYVQRTMILDAQPEVHPLLRRISQIHVTEEARHVSFARAFLRTHVPKLSKLRLTHLRIAAPVILGVMSRLMMQPPPPVVRAYDIPRRVMDEAFRDNPSHHARKHAALAQVAALCRELGVLVPLTRPLWRRFDLIGSQRNDSPLHA